MLNLFLVDLDMQAGALLFIFESETHQQNL